MPAKIDSSTDIRKPDVAPETDATLHQTIGAMKATVEHLTEAVRNMTTMWGNQEKDAAAGRRAVYERVEALNVNVVALTGRVGNVEARLTEIKPAVDEFKDQRSEQRGAMKLGKMLWVGMLAACGSTGAAIGWGLSHLFGNVPIPPPGH